MTGRKITDALLYVGKAQRLPRDSNGFVFFEELRPFLDDVMRNAAEIKEETPGKLDSPIEVVFPDGSKARLIKQSADDEKAYNLLEKAGYESGLGTGGPSYVANLYKQDDDGNEFAVEVDF